MLCEELLFAARSIELQAVLLGSELKAVAPSEWWVAVVAAPSEDVSAPIGVVELAPSEDVTAPSGRVARSASTEDVLQGPPSEAGQVTA